MSFVLSVIGNPALPPALSDERLAAITAAIGADDNAKILAPGLAAEWTVTDKAAALAAARTAVGDAPLDVMVTPARGRRKRLLIADMDSTMITCECIDELADFAGVKAEVAAITERSMAGELNFEDSLIARVQLLHGLPVDALERVFAERVSYTPGGSTLLATMRAHGAKAALISGGFTFFTERVAAALGFDHHRANVLRHDPSGHLSGTVARPILGPDAKLEALQLYCGEYGLKAQDVLAVGDGANDLRMIEAAGLGAAFRAKPRVVEAADIAIKHGDLTALLYVQGYTHDAFVDG